MIPTKLKTYADSLSFHNNSALRRLGISFDFTGQKDLSGLLRLIETVPAESLEYLSILFSHVVQTSGALGVEEEWWRDLDEVLSTDRFKNLRAVDITPSYEKYGDEMAKANQKGILTVTPPRMFP